LLECIILIGLPGAGKTTFYRQYFAATHTHISKDLWPHASGREARQHRLLDEALAAGRSVVVDNTNPRVADRQPLIAAARAHGAQAVGYFVDVSPRVAVARNEQRSGRAKVPKVAIFTVAKRLERPTVAEGFDQLFCVQIADDGSFHVCAVGAPQR
jgi:predicted kinase